MPREYCLCAGGCGARWSNRQQSFIKNGCSVHPAGVQCPHKNRETHQTTTGMKCMYCSLPCNGSVVVKGRRTPWFGSNDGHLYGECDMYQHSDTVEQPSTPVSPPATPVSPPDLTDIKKFPKLGKRDKDVNEPQEYAESEGTEFCGDRGPHHEITAISSENDSTRLTDAETQSILSGQSFQNGFSERDMSILQNAITLLKSGPGKGNCQIIAESLKSIMPPNMAPIGNNNIGLQLYGYQQVQPQLYRSQQFQPQFCDGAYWQQQQYCC